MTQRYRHRPIHKDPFPLRLRAQSLVVRAERAALDYGELLQGRVTLTEVGALENDIDAVSHRWKPYEPVYIEGFYGDYLSFGTRFLQST